MTPFFALKFMGLRWWHRVGGRTEAHGLK